MGRRTRRAAADARPTRRVAARPRVAGPPRVDDPLRSAVVRAVHARCVTPADEDDLVNDVLLAIGKGRADWRGRSSFTTWVWSVVRRRLRDERRHGALERRRLRELTILAALVYGEDRSPEKLAIRSEEFRRALSTLESLPRRDALCFVLLRVADWSAADVAARLGTTAGAVRVRACRVAARLRASLEGSVAGDVVPPPRTRAHTHTPPIDAEGFHQEVVADRGTKMCNDPPGAATNRVEANGDDAPARPVMQGLRSGTGETGMRHGAHNILLVAAVLLLDPAVSRSHVSGTDDADVIVYGRMFHWAVADGGGWAWRYLGEGGCVYEYDAYNSPTMRGDYNYEDEDDWGDGWSVWGGYDDDWIYSPSEFDGGSLVCKAGFHKVETDTFNEYLTYIHGDWGEYSTGGDDTLYACPSWHCVVYGNGGVDDIMGGTAYDSLDGEDGVDEIRGGAGPDYIYGGHGNDWRYGDEGGDHIYGYYGNDHLYGGDDDDYLYGEHGTNYLYGGDDDDYLFGGDGTDYLYGQSGDDDECYGNAGTDYCGTSSPYYCETTGTCSTGGS